uniref:ETS domain-containing protein n=2 Tax=Mesocestoides corti TaxID=53468 RepID=A0A5K3FD25_MESCO
MRIILFCMPTGTCMQICTCCSLSDTPEPSLYHSLCCVQHFTMTEIGFSHPESSLGSKCSDCMGSLIDTFWTDTLDFLDPAVVSNEEPEPNSPGSTKSAASLDSLLQTTSTDTSSSSPPDLPWKDEVDEESLQPSPERVASLSRDPDLQIAENGAWSQKLKSKSQGNIAVDLLHEFNETERNILSNGLEEQLASVDNAWTATVELPALAADDVTQLLSQRPVSVPQPSHHPYQRKRRHKEPKSKSSRRRISTLHVFSEHPDSDSTETGSEGENAPTPTTTLRKRCRMLIAGRAEVVEDLGSSEEDDQAPLKKAVHRHYQLQTTDDTKPWWPLRSGSVQQRLEARELEGGGVARNRRQLELWEFILRSLDAKPLNCTSSAFEWVDRSVGVFRVTNTQKAAKEWGHYRGNSRMDYEKMARAMRFYYKDSVLRKARKQLHFQFAMPFVTWSDQQHFLDNEYSPPICL